MQKSSSRSFTGPAAVGAEEPLTTTVATARRLSGLGNTTVWRLISDGTLASVTIGRRRLIVYESLRRLLAPDQQPQPRPRGRPRKQVVTGGPVVTS
jgi:excisionase family DNA binding protein